MQSKCFPVFFEEVFSLSGPSNCHKFLAWWCHKMGTLSTLVIFCEGNPPVNSGFPSQKLVTRDFDVFFHLRRNKRLNIQSRRLWFETPLRSLWRHWNEKKEFLCPLTLIPRKKDRSSDLLHEEDTPPPSKMFHIYIYIMLKQIITVHELGQRQVWYY